MDEGKSPAGTREKIIDLVEGLIMERGFNAISYQDIADRIAIRKASIHYHFPAKADLGVAVIEQYLDKLQGIAVPVADLDQRGVRQAFEVFLGMFQDVAAENGLICLAGVLGAEFETLPEVMRAAVRRFYIDASEWLACLIDHGHALGVMSPITPSATTADAIVAMLEGSLIMARVQADPNQVAAACALARRMCGIEPV